jgi:hypothetical protein
MLCSHVSAAVGALVGATVATGSAVAAVAATVGVSVSPGIGAARQRQFYSLVHQQTRVAITR